MCSSDLLTTGAGSARTAGDEATLAVYRDQLGEIETDKARGILDAAEVLFIQGGFESMSMRQITGAAGVNLAAVNYHFGSKDALIQAVLSRRLDPLNDQRVQMLDAFERELADKLSCEHVLTAMFLPAVRIFRSNTPGADRYLQFLGRAYTEQIGRAHV